MKRFLPLALLLPATVLAQEPFETSYNYFDVNYLGTSWDLGPADVDGNGYSARFSVALREHLFLLGDYAAWEFDGSSGGSTGTTLGLGSNWVLKDKWSVWGAAGFRSIDLDIGLGNVEEETGFLSGGVRWQVSDGYELRFSADFADLSPARTGELRAMIGGDIYLTETVALSLEASQTEDESTSFLIGLRFYHDRDSSGYRQRR